jgi:hypothetical protein
VAADKDDKSVQGAARVSGLALKMAWKKRLPFPVTTPNSISAAMLVSSECCGRRQEIGTMSFFRCSNGCVEDTALCNYWAARIRDTPTLCSGCDCKIDKWHGQFPRESAENWITDERGFLFRKSEVEHWLGQSIEVIA